MSRQVRLVPHLVVVHLRAVAGGEGSGESGEAVGVGGWDGGTIVEDDHQSQPGMTGQRGHDAVRDGPVEAAWLRLDLAPVEGLAHPDEASLGDAGQGSLQFLAFPIIVLLQRDVDAEDGHVGSGHGRGEAAGETARAGLVGYDDGLRGQTDNEQQGQPQE